MCFILLSTCNTCTSTIHKRYALCTHAASHSFDPATCPNRMKRRRSSAGKICEKCEPRRGSLSEMPSAEGSATREGQEEKREEEERYAEVLKVLGMSRARRMTRRARGNGNGEGKK
ncbi:hypothetical protein IQ06DRAFT_305025 [Phaeosphaeriaceae sp. SRC1lsM3a]|nr:hypothetical protein IQ06DRAFT_305025 [Stagonospora sp. SRC1lsM3a]